MDDKGAPAALFMAIGKTLLQKTMMDEATVAGAITSANRSLMVNNDNSMFITIWAGVLDLETGVLRFTNAGHTKPLLVSDGKADFLEIKHGMPIGLMDFGLYGQSEITLHPGDRIVLYTDGVTEANSESGELFGRDRLKDYFEQRPEGSAKELLDDLIAEIDGFSGNAQQSDDITMMVIRYR